MNQDKLKAWLCLKNAPGMGPKMAQRLLEAYPDPCKFVGVPEHAVYFSDLIPDKAKSYLRIAEPLPSLIQIIKLMETYQISFTCLTDADYPEDLAVLFSPPLILYYRGGLHEALNSKRLAVVGTRKPSSYGREMTAKLLKPVCENGVTIISGLAMGIDTVAHQTAVENGTKTIAVLASGVESIYPLFNKPLSQQIINNGALISEYEPGSKMEKWNFPARNRLISALGDAVFITEGQMTSGALLTGKFALEQGKDILALPGNVNHQNAQGPNYMIKTGACLVTCPEDILERLGIEDKPTEQLEIFPELSVEEGAVLKRLQEESREISFDELLLLTGHNFGRLSVILLNLELKGLVAKSGNGAYITK
ncbi:MAG TPA: DNA-processing protein DprA [Candidatus Cloacimonadota bacterium]|nr:DNA-processing protein DprA [Candidatus Cloacimonadota bacterium]HPS39262.1 DNA-processing protein DprA [Candidatus Cloacimonadota bacterium]